MYRRKRRSGFSNFLILMLLGTFAGVVFLMFDNLRSSGDRAALPLTPTVNAARSESSPFSPTATPRQPHAGAGGINIPPSVTPASVQAVESATVLGTVAAQRPYISIPALGVYAPIIEVFLDGTSWDVTRLGTDVGHLQGTAWLDEPGNIVLSGHVELRDGRQGAFRELESLEVGDYISVMYRDTARSYEVVEHYDVEPTDLEPLYPSDSDQLTLITCGEYDFFSGSYLKRVVIVAERVG